MRGEADVIRTRGRVQLPRDGLPVEANRVSDFEQYLYTLLTERWCLFFSVKKRGFWTVSRRGEMTKNERKTIEKRKVK